jgi:hypothetical protein
MKTTLWVTVMVALSLTNCSNDKNEVLVPLTTQELNDLKFLREEEKLAHDVYVYSYAKYQEASFGSISQSEQRHMDAVLNLFDKYGITDNASAEVGVFNNPDLQQLYTDLVSQSAISATEALKVGAKIEDLDLNDIKHFVANTSNTSLLSTYATLSCGSKNHLRSFTDQLMSYGISYTPEFILLEEYNSILASPSGGCGQKFNKH